MSYKKKYKMINKFNKKILNNKMIFKVFKKQILYKILLVHQDIKNKPNLLMIFNLINARFKKIKVI